MTGMLFLSSHASEIHFSLYILFAQEELRRLWIFRGIDLMWGNSCRETKKYV